MYDLKQFFAEHPKCALAFSAGVDSSFLLYAALKYGAEVRAYYVNTAFQPAFELSMAHRMAEDLGADLRVLEYDILSDPDVAANVPRRCYFCKRRLFTLIRNAAEADGFSLLLDGTNASDDDADRPGMLALGELGVRSPLRECGLTKDKIRALSREAGLITWDMPAYSCLATRIPSGVVLTEALLHRTEQAEDYMRTLGFTDFRVRTLGRQAKLQITADQLPLALERRREILDTLKQTYDGVLLDLEARNEH